MYNKKTFLSSYGPLSNEAIQRVSKAKLLGIIVDQHLNRKDHILMDHTKFLNHVA